MWHDHAALRSILDCPRPRRLGGSVKLIGRLHGTSKWKVNGRRVTALNALAKQLLGGCR